MRQKCVRNSWNARMLGTPVPCICTRVAQPALACSCSSQRLPNHRLGLTHARLHGTLPLFLRKHLFWRVLAAAVPRARLFTRITHSHWYACHIMLLIAGTCCLHDSAHKLHDCFKQRLRGLRATCKVRVAGPVLPSEASRILGFNAHLLLSRCHIPKDGSHPRPFLDPYQPGW